MTETEYVTVSNLARVRAALKIIQDLASNFGVTEEEKKALANQLYDIEERISETIKTTEDPQ
jgi:ribosomal protein S7